jgi:hypothetical protein
MRVRATIVAIAAGILVATGANAVNVQETVEMITHSSVTMKDGTVMPMEIVRMNGKLYVMMAVDDLPDYLHQQVLKVMPQ